MTLSNWDIDLRDGLAGESVIAQLLGIDTVEVKTQKQLPHTGNVFVETCCYSQRTGQYEPSGITTSKATHWAFTIGETGAFIVSRYDLLVACHESRFIHINRPPNPAKGYLIPIRELIKGMAS